MNEATLDQPILKYYNEKGELEDFYYVPAHFVIDTGWRSRPGHLEISYDFPEDA